MPFYGSRISGNIAIRKPEGYLICQNVPVARTGTQEYMPQEIGQDGDSMITVYRTEEEVFSPATIASFEGMPVTNDHPGQEVDASNIQLFQRGHAQNVRRGTGDQSDLLLADLIITHPDLIDAVQKGKREVSCGYQCEYKEIDGKAYQRAIRGNHVAVVEQGRAGSRVAIKDQRPAQGKERSNTAMSTKPNGILGKLFKSFAQDADPEELEVAGKQLFGASEPVKEKDETPPVNPAPPAPAAQQTPPPQKDDPDPVVAALTAVTAKLDALLQKMEPGAAKPADEDPLAQLEKEVSGESPAAPEGNLIDPEKMADEDTPPEGEKKEEGKTTSQDSVGMKAAIDAIKPIIAKLPADQRRAASDAAVKSLRSAYGMNATPVPGSNAYLPIKQTATAPKGTKDAHPVNERALGENIMKARNANCQAKEDRQGK